ncbi:antibiotic biosynthesis monooxygenase family protein [Desulfospira joergensenii]|uniref:antibiotic biosynthesis monooxygenase family protein n=1 Tax=Desulfospira joergensenii TaxID=53329 RepID=UPI0003B67C05|nr:antibiotic biosynthesis monooxygenase [Desulfospira joergensenii]
MPVKVVIKRKFKNPDIPKISQMLVQARTNAMHEQGYISSETLRGCENPNEIVVLSMWEEKKDWDNFKDCSTRRELEAVFAEMLEAPAEAVVYRMGMGAP